MASYARKVLNFEINDSTTNMFSGDFKDNPEKLLMTSIFINNNKKEKLIIRNPVLVILTTPEETKAYHGLHYDFEQFINKSGFVTDVWDGIETSKCSLVAGQEIPLDVYYWPDTAEDIHEFNITWDYPPKNFFFSLFLRNP